MFGKISLLHDSPLPHISVDRLCLVLLVLTFTIYLIPGLWGAPLQLISALPPLMEYSEISPVFGSSGNNAAATVLPDGAKLKPH